MLLDERGAIALADFDLVRALDTTGGTRTGAMGSFMFAAPEAIIDANKAGPAADVYGLAMTTLFALTKGCAPHLYDSSMREVVMRFS